MMFNSGYVLAIKDQARKILREIEGRVYLPLNSEYSLFIKNNNPSRAVCTVSIDGTDVLGGNELIIGSHGSVDLERFVADGDLSNGRRFRFVPLSNSDVQDPSSSKNGIIEVRFWRELPPPPPPSPGIIRNLSFGCRTKGAGGSCLDSSPAATAFYCSADLGAHDMYAPCSEGMAGATVAGSHSGQQFAHGYFRGKDGGSVVLRLQLLGRKEALTVSNTQHQHCGFCGKRVPWGNQFCGGCGMRIEALV